MSDDGPRCDDNSQIEEEHCLTAEDRRRIMGHVHSLLYWTGHMVPDVWEIDGQRVLLRDTVFRFITKEDPSEEEVAAARALAQGLEREAERLEKEVGAEDMSKAQGKLVLEEISGLLRAVDQLRSVREDDAEYDKKTFMRMVSDEKRWMHFVKKVS